MKLGATMINFVSHWFACLTDAEIAAQLVGRKFKLEFLLITLTLKNPSEHNVLYKFKPFLKYS